MSRVCLILAKYQCRVALLRIYTHTHVCVDFLWILVLMGTGNCVLANTGREIPFRQQADTRRREPGSL